MPQSVLPDRPHLGADLVGRRRRSLLTNLVVLAVAAAALLCFIAVVADVRRAGNAMRQATIQAEHFTLIMQGTGALPLNLEAYVPEGGDPRLVAFDWISTGDALKLRGTPEPVLAAWSPPVFQLFGPEGRAVVIFEAGEFTGQWMRNDEFLARRAAQEERLQR